MIRRSPPHHKILGQKAKSNHWDDFNESPMIWTPFYLMLVGELVFCFTIDECHRCCRLRCCNSLLPDICVNLAVYLLQRVEEQIVAAVTNQLLSSDRFMAGPSERHPQVGPFGPPRDRPMPQMGSSSQERYLPQVGLGDRDDYHNLASVDSGVDMGSHENSFSTSPVTSSDADHPSRPFPNFQQGHIASDIHIKKEPQDLTESNCGYNKATVGQQEPWEPWRLPGTVAPPGGGSLDPHDSLTSPSGSSCSSLSSKAHFSSPVIKELIQQVLASGKGQKLQETLQQLLLKVMETDAEQQDGDAAGSGSSKETPNHSRHSISLGEIPRSKSDNSLTPLREDAGAVCGHGNNNNNNNTESHKQQQQQQHNNNKTTCNPDTSRLLKNGVSDMEIDENDMDQYCEQGWSQEKIDMIESTVRKLHKVAEIHRTLFADRTRKMRDELSGKIPVRYRSYRFFTKGWIAYLFLVRMIFAMKLFVNREQIRLLNSKTTDLDWNYSGHHQKLKFLICDLLSMVHI